MLTFTVSIIDSANTVSSMSGIVSKFDSPEIVKVIFRNKYATKGHDVTSKNSEA